MGAFLRYLSNTILITVLGTAGHVIFASAAAYPLAKYRFPGSKALSTMIVLSLMFTPHVTGIPNYMIMSAVRVDRYACLDNNSGMGFPAWTFSNEAVYGTASYFIAGSG